MFWFLLSKSTCYYVSFWTSLYFALTGQEQEHGVWGQHWKSICLQQPPRHWRANKDSQNAVSLQEQQQGQAEVHTKFCGQALISLDCFNKIRILFLVSFDCQAAQTPSSTKAHAFYLVHFFSSSPSFTCFLLPRVPLESATPLSFFG